MNVTELKDLLKIESDQELASVLQRGVSSVSNWRKSGEVPIAIEVKAKKLIESVAGFSGDYNTINIGAHMPPELHIIRNMMSQWDEKRRKKLLRFALELDDET
jgi:hypothetical protein